MLFSLQKKEGSIENRLFTVKTVCLQSHCSYELLEIEWTKKNNEF